MSYELLRTVLDDEALTGAFFSAADSLAKAEVPTEVASALFAARMTALSKKDGSARGIATGHAFRRLVARTLARQFMPQVEAACAPYQFALSTRAGTDCVGHAIRLATDLDARLTVLSINGVGAYDHVLLQAILSGLNAAREVRAILPFVRMAYASFDIFTVTVS